MKKILVFIFLNISIFAQAQLDANSVMGLPTATTVPEMNAVTTATAGSIVYNLENSKAYLFNGASWLTVSNDGWSVDGNTGLAGANFLGHKDDVAMEIRSDNLPLLQFGRRGTLGLVETLTDYTDPTQPLVIVNGDGATSALQFAADVADFYKPIFLTNTDGNFRLKGSAAGTDFFEIGSAGTLSNGSVEFLIGDDGLEPFIFKRLHGSDQTIQELMRIQGSTDSTNSADAKTRVGINTNALANSTLQVSNSLSKSIERTSGPLTLTEDHYSIIIENASHTITLPNAVNAEGREYVIKNANKTEVTISSYQDNTDTNAVTIPEGNVLKLQSNGTNWEQINNYNFAEIITIPVVSTNLSLQQGTRDRLVFAIIIIIDDHVSNPNIPAGDWGVAITGVAYQTLPTITIGFDFTYDVETVQNADGVTWDHFLTGTSDLNVAANGGSPVFRVQGAAPSPQGNCVNVTCGDFVIFDL